MSLVPGCKCLKDSVTSRGKDPPSPTLFMPMLAMFIIFQSHVFGFKKQRWGLGHLPQTCEDSCSIVVLVASTDSTTYFPALFDAKTTIQTDRYMRDALKLQPL